MAVPRHARLESLYLEPRLLGYGVYSRFGEFGTINRKYTFMFLVLARYFDRPITGLL